MSTVKVNTVDKRTGSTLTLGGCGTTVTLGAGATQSGFGRTGTVDWCTTAKTAPFTGVSGKGYFVNTTCGAVTVTLPSSPSAGDIISVADYASTWNTNNVTLCNNSSKINGVCSTASLSTQGQSITLVYVDATRGWKNTMDSTSNVTANPAYIVATGGTISCCGNYKIHTFTSDGCFAVTNAGTPAGSTTVDYLVVAGGAGGGGNPAGGGGGSGGFRESKNPAAPWTASPLASATSLPVSVTTYPITVGGGGSGALLQLNGCNGSDSSFSTITSTGGGGGGADNTPNGNAKTGGSGGGGGFRSPGPWTVGAAGNTPPVSPPQGNPGGNSTSSTANPDRAGGGGGAGAAGGTVGCGPSGAPGGAGATTSISGSPTIYAGGGGGGKDEDVPNGGTSGDGGPGGGGRGASSDSANSRAGQNGTANTGGGGGGAGGAPYPSGYSGGSGIVIIRYKYQ